jgi:hypothetical protein
MITDASQFIIERSKWCYGQGKNTKLLDSAGKKDCIGFFLIASGFKKEDLLGLDEPIELTYKHEWFTKLIDWHGSSCMQSPICNDIIQINDYAAMDDAAREKKLTKLFESIGVTLTFVD